MRREEGVRVALCRTLANLARVVHHPLRAAADRRHVHHWTLLVVQRERAAAIVVGLRLHGVLAKGAWQQVWVFLDVPRPARRVAAPHRKGHAVGQQAHAQKQQRLLVVPARLLLGHRVRAEHEVWPARVRRPERLLA